MKTEKTHMFTAFNLRGNVMTLILTIKGLLDNLYLNDNIKGFWFLGKDYKQHVITIMDHEGLWSIMGDKEYKSPWILEDAIKELVY